MIVVHKVMNYLSVWSVSLKHKRKIDNITIRYNLLHDFIFHINLLPSNLYFSHRNYMFSQVY